MIKIECKGADTLPLDAIEEFQGELKRRTKKDINKIITSIEKYGFSFPFFIRNETGHNYCLDGHGRILALAEMRKRGEDLPMFPVVYVEAKNEEEAKNKLLRLNSQYGEITKSGFMEFTTDISFDVDELNIPGVELLDISQEEIEKQKEKTEVSEKPYKMVHVLLSMEPDIFLEHLHEFKKLKDISGVEYVQSEN